MGDVLAATVPIFAVVALGYLVTRLGVLRRTDMSVLASYVVQVALPALVFVSVSAGPVGQVVNPTYLLTYAVAALAMMGLGRAWGSARRAHPARSATVAFAAGGTNNGFVGFPVLLLVLPEVAGVAVGMAMLVDSLVLLPVVLGMYESAEGHRAGLAEQLRGVLARVLTHPMVGAIVLGVVVGGLGITLPAVLERPVSLVADSASAVALFAIGGMLVGLRLRGNRADVAAAVSGKLLLMPGLAVALVLLLPLLGLPGLDPELRAAVLLICALPSMSAVAAIAEEHGQGELGAAAMLTSTICSFLTLTAWMVVLAAVGWF